MIKIVKNGYINVNIMVLLLDGIPKPPALIKSFNIGHVGIQSMSVNVFVFTVEMIAYQRNFSMIQNNQKQIHQRKYHGTIIRWYFKTPCAHKNIQYRPCLNSIHVRKFVRFYLD